MYKCNSYILIRILKMMIRMVWGKDSTTLICKDWKTHGIYMFDWSLHIIGVWVPDCFFKWRDN